MATTLTYGATTVQLLGAPLWADEYAWKAVEQRMRYSVTGAPVVEAATRQAGRPIKLSGDGNRLWVTRAVLETLRAWAALPAQAFQLVLRDEPARSVVFDHEAGAIDAEPIFGLADVQAGDYYRVTLRFIEV